MPCTHDFIYIKPKNLSEATKHLKDFGSKTRILAGGTDLAVHIKEGLATPENVLDIKDISELSKLENKNGKLFVGALVTFTDLIDSKSVKKDFPMLIEASETVASTGIRNRATLVGNLCSAVPSLDCAPTLLVYNAVVVLMSAKGERRVSIDEWFISPRKTAIKEDEIVIGVELEKPKNKHAGIYVKLGRYRGEDLAQAGLGLFYVENEGYRVAYCAVAPTPKRCENVEKILNSGKFSKTLVEKAVEALMAEISPITDIRASKEYRMHMMGVMLERGLEAVNDRLAGKKVSHTDLLGG